MKIRLFTAAAILAMAALTATTQAAAAVVTFGQTMLGRGSWVYSEAGFTVTATGGILQPDFFIQKSSNCGPTCSDNGTYWAMVMSYPYADTIVVKAADNHLFNLNSFDGAETFSDRENFWATGIRVTGVSANDSLVTENFMLDWINDGLGGVADFQAFHPRFEGGFKEIRFSGIFSGIQGHSRDFTIDNLNLTDADVPEPQTTALFGIGLLGFWTIRRKSAKTASK